jgi:hypothetical protein
MADATEDEIVLDDAPAPEPEVVVTDKKYTAPDDGLQQLRRQLDSETTARQNAEREAAAARERAYAAMTETHENRLSLVSNAIDTVQQSNAMLKARLREAMAVGDYDAAADIQEAMTVNAAKLMQLEQGRQSLEQQPAPQQPRYQAPDPVEALAQQLSPRSAAWIRAHPEYARDPRLNQRMLAAHNLVTSYGVPEDSDEYFAEIEDKLQVRPQSRREEPDDAMAAAATVTQRRASPAAAPVSRDRDPTPGSKPRTISLSAAEREAAEASGMSYVDYWKAQQALKKEGRLH